MTIPNILSIIRIILIIPTAIYLWNGENVTAAILCFIGAALDISDGIIARKFNQISELGKILDPLADKLYFATLVILLFLLNRLPLWFFLAILIRDGLILLGGGLIARRLKMVLPANYIGKATACVIGLTLVLAVLDLEFIRVWGIWVTTAFMVWSLFGYAKYAIKALKVKEA